MSPENAGTALERSRFVLAVTKNAGTAMKRWNGTATNPLGTSQKLALRQIGTAGTVRNVGRVLTLRSVPTISLWWNAGTLWR
jgi:hypothetical protein